MTKGISLRYRLPAVALVLAILMALTAQIDLPVPGSPVPVSVNNLFVLLAGLLLGRWWGLGSVLLYLAFGLVGLPVFSDGGFGWSHLMGPTGGYLIGYALAAFLSGWIAEKRPVSWWQDSVAATVGAACFFMVGLPWLKRVADLSWEKTLAVGFQPFVVGGIVKIMLAVVLARWFRNVLR